MFSGLRIRVEVCFCQVSKMARLLRDVCNFHRQPGFFPAGIMVFICSPNAKSCTILNSHKQIYRKSTVIASAKPTAWTGNWAFWYRCQTSFSVPLRVVLVRSFGEQTRTCSCTLKFWTGNLTFPDFHVVKTYQNEFLFLTNKISMRTILVCDMGFFFHKETIDIDGDILTFQPCLHQPLFSQIKNTENLFVGVLMNHLRSFFTLKFKF